MRILYGDDLILSILKKELKAMNAKAEKAKANADAYTEAGSKLMELRRRFAEIMQGGELRQQMSKHKAELDQMVKDEAALLRIHKQDYLKLLNAQSDAEIQRDELVSVISNLEWRLSLRNRRT